MRKEVANRTARIEFDSLAELSRYIVEAPRTWPYRQAEETEASKQWDLGVGYKEAVRLAAEGWLEGAREAEAALAQFAPKDPEPDLVTDFYGHMPHVARYCAGAPDSMIRKAPRADNGMGKVLTLYIPVNANGYVKAECMRNFGLGVAQYVNELETSRGVRCELYGTATSAFSDMRVTHTWRIKHADQPLDFAVLCFSIGHPAMLRRLEFALCERSPALPSYGYGSAEVAKLSDLIDPAHGAYILNGMERANTVAATPADALAFVEAQINKALEVPDAD